MTTFGDTLTSLADSERQFAQIAQDVVALYNAGALRPQDIALYDAARVDVYSAQIVAWGFFTANVARQLPTPVASLIPVPQIAPALPVSANAGMAPPAQPVTTSTSGLRGLGFAPIVIAIGALEITIPVWALVIVAIAVVMTICYALSVTANTLLAIAQLDQEITTLRNYYDTQLSALRTCLAQPGATAATCAAAMAAVQTPQQALPQPPPPGGDASEWPKYFLIGAGAVIALGVIMAMRGSSAPAHESSGAPRRLYLTAGD